RPVAQRAGSRPWTEAHVTGSDPSGPRRGFVGPTPEAGYTGAASSGGCAPHEGKPVAGRPSRLAAGAVRRPKKRPAVRQELIDGEPRNPVPRQALSRVPARAAPALGRGLGVRVRRGRLPGFRLLRRVLQAGGGRRGDALPHVRPGDVSPAPARALSAAALILALQAAPAIGDVFVLRGGDRITGDPVTEGKRTFKVKTPYGLLTIPRSKVDHIIRADGT